MQVGLPDAELVALLRKARAHNQRHHITGVLLYHAGQFVAVLEGPHEAVRALYERIRRDARHRNVLLLSDGPSERRVFPDWSMGFVAALPEALRQPPAGYFNPKAPAFLRQHAPNASPYLLHLLQDFVTAQPEDEEQWIISNEQWARSHKQ